MPASIAGPAAAAAIATLLAAACAGPGPDSAAVAHATHPEPRAEASADMVAPADAFADHPHAAHVYVMAAEIPEILDGLHCYCGCHDYQHEPHRSLLTCFADDHSVGCGVCLGEAAMAHQLAAEGATLDEIRTRIDHAFAASAGSCGPGSTCPGAGAGDGADDDAWRDDPDRTRLWELMVGGDTAAPSSSRPARDGAR